MDAAQGCLSGPMPDAVTVPHAPRRISRRCAGLPAAGTPPRRLLRRLLLGFDGSFVRGRGDECALDRAPGTTRPSGETYSLRPMDRAHCWRCLSCGRGLDVVAYIFTIGRHPSLDHALRGTFLHVRRADARRHSVWRDRCEATRDAARSGLISRVGGSAGHTAPRLTGLTA